HIKLVSYSLCSPILQSVDTNAEPFYNVSYCCSYDDRFMELEIFLYGARKGVHAISVQGICDLNNMFQNFVVRWRRSFHGAFVYNNCEFV
ncbi:hypothetical protein MAR_022169, partial [Mya arenaria]